MFRGMRKMLSLCSHWMGRKENKIVSVIKYFLFIWVNYFYTKVPTIRFYQQSSNEQSYRAINEFFVTYLWGIYFAFANYISHTHTLTHIHIHTRARGNTRAFKREMLLRIYFLRLHQMNSTLNFCIYNSYPRGYHMLKARRCVYIHTTTFVWLLGWSVYCVFSVCPISLVSIYSRNFSWMLSKSKGSIEHLH